MEFLSEAGLLDEVVKAAPELGFQFKNGAVFHKQGQRTEFDFTQKFTAGPGTTFQVKRASFDKVLADAAANKGVDIRYGVEVVGISRERSSKFSACENCQTVVNNTLSVDSYWMLQALDEYCHVFLNLNLHRDSLCGKPVFAIFKIIFRIQILTTNKILITVHPELIDVWFWLIPFSDGSASLGVVGETQRFTQFNTDHDALWQSVFR
ncbi:MAG: hypothetical protein U5L01_11295 [Rheinheimera sp.]|nr:hypothetical protein [Rheinheimera sp.]